MVPIFPRHIWNLQEHSSTGLTRTTNSLEAYHHSFNALVSCQQLSLWTLLKIVSTVNRPYHKAQSTTFTEAQSSLSIPRRGEGMKDSRNSPLSRQGQEWIDSFVESL